MWPFSRNSAQQPPPAKLRLPEDRYGTQTPPGRSLGILAWLRQIGLPWFGPRLSQGTPVMREVEREKVRLGPPNVILPQFLPYLDNYTYETPEHRRAYREMWRSPEVKTAVTSKILGVKSLDLKMKPADKKNPRDIEVADFVRWALTRRLRDGVPGLVWSITAVGLTDGYSVNAKVRGIQDGGRWAGNIILRELKTIDTGNDGVLQTDDKFNVVGFMGLRYNAGMEFSPADLLIWRNAPQYNSPTGMSDFRAAYNSFWTIDTVKKIRNMGLEKRALPILLGQYPEGNTVAQASLQAALALAKSQNWLVIPDTTKVDVLNIAGSADAQFQAAIDSEEHKIFLSIQGAYLQSLEGETEQGRGDTQVHKSTSELRVWDLAASLEALINDHEQGLVRELVDLNYVVSDYPYASLTAVDVNELKQDLEVDKGLQGLGLTLGKDELYERYDREPPEPGSEDELKPPSAGGGGPPGAGGAPPPPGQPPPGAQLAEPQDFVETDKQGYYHGPEAPGPGWTEAGVGPHGGKRWQRQEGGDQQPDEARHPDHKDDADAQARAHGLIGRLKAGLGRIFGALDKRTDVPAVRQAKRAIGAGLKALGTAQTKLYQVMEKRYGKKGAKAIFLAAQATGSNPLVAPPWFIALPGSTLLAQLPLMGVAEGLLQAGRAARAAGQGLKKVAGFSALAEQLTPEEVEDLARGVVRRLGEAFFEALELRKDDLAEGLGAALGRPQLPEQQAEEFEEEYHGPKPPGEGWQQVGTGPKGGKIWRKGPKSQGAKEPPAEPEGKTFEKTPATRGRMMQAVRDGKGKDAKILLRNGQPAPEHIKPAMVPPDWQHVEVSLDPKADLLVKAVDSKGRIKSVYADSFHLRNAAVKFARVDEMIRKGPEIDRQIQEARKDPRKREAADCAWLMAEQATRPGSDSDTGGKVKAYGATTLEGRHVTVDEGGTVRLSFIGKEGVRHDHVIRDPALAKMLVERSDKAGANGRLFQTNEGKVNDFIGTLNGGHFTAKDFRTRRANLLAAQEVRKHAEPPANEKEYKARVKAVAERVSDVLGNRPAQALESYINPAVFAGWRAAT